MNDIQSFIDRQLGFYSRPSYDSVLRRLVVREESFYGLSGAGDGAALGDQDPPIFACRFAELGGREHILALANEDGKVAIQDTTERYAVSSLESFQCHNNAVFDLAWMPGSLNFVTVSGDHTACLWDLSAGGPRRVLTFSAHTRSVKTAVFRPTAPDVFATGARDGHILLWDTRASSQPSQTLARPDNCLTSCHSVFSPLSARAQHARRARSEHRAISITGLVFQDDNTLISCGECDGNLKVWDIRKNYSAFKREPLPRHCLPYCGGSSRNGYTSLVVDGGGRRLYASCMDNVIYCFNISTYSGPPVRRYVGHSSASFYVKAALSADGLYLVSGSSDKRAYVWNVNCSTPILRLVAHRAEVTCASWGGASRGGASLGALVTCSDDARHMLWRVGTDDDDVLLLKGRAEPVPVPPSSLPCPRWPSPGPGPGPALSPHSPRGDKRPRCGDTLSPRSAKRPRAGTHCRADTATKRCLADLMSSENRSHSPSKRARTASITTSPLLPAGQITSSLCPAGQTASSLCPAGQTASSLCPAGQTASSLCPAGQTASSLCPAGQTASSLCPAGQTASSLCPAGQTASSLCPAGQTASSRCPAGQDTSPLRPAGVKRPAADDAGSPKRVLRDGERTPPRAPRAPPRVLSPLPDWAARGEAPHLRLMSPLKPRPAPRAHWLSRLAQQRQGRAPPAPAPAPAPASPKGPPPPRRASLTEKTKSKKPRTLLKYFSVHKVKE